MVFLKKTTENSIYDLLNIISIVFPIVGLSIFNNMYIIIISFVIQIITVILNIKINKLKLTNRNKNILLIILMFFVITIIIDLLGNYLYNTIKTTVLVFSSMFLIYFVIVTDNNSVKNTNKVLNFIVKYTVFLVIYSIVIKKFGNTPVLYKTDDGIIVFRQYLNIFGIKFFQNLCGDININYAVASLTGNPNTLSSLIIIAILIVLVEILIKESYKKNIKINILKLAILIYGLYLAHSRMCMLIAIILTPICFILNQTVKNINKKNVFYIFSFIMLMILILIILLNPNLFRRIDLNGRDIIWKVAKEEITENPFNLNGLGSSGIIINEIAGKSISMHNAYLAFLIDYGIIISIVFFAVIIYKTIASTKYIFNGENKDKSIYIKILLIFVCLLLNGFSEGTFMTYSMYNYLFFWSLFNMSLLKDCKGENDDNNIHTNIQ